MAVAEAASGTSALDVRLNTHTASLNAGEQVTLTAQVLPTTATDQTVTWASGNDAVATVSGGVVTGVGTGTATITVTTNDGGLTDTCTVSVVTRAQSVSLNRSTASIDEGDTLTLTATVLPADASDKTVSWSSSKTSVATVSGGVVTGVGEGTATITATTNDGGYTATCTVDVAAVNIASGVYSVSQTANTLRGVHEKTSVLQLKNNLDNDPGEIFVFRADGTAYTGDAVGTGMTVKRISGGVVTDQLTIIVSADCNGDGSISIADYTLIRLDILKLKTLKNGYILSADVNGDGKVSIADYTLVRLHILDLKTIG